MNHQKVIVVFRTGKIYEFDMVLNELDAAGVPTFTQHQTSSGLRLATPATLTGDAGSWWTIGVPESLTDQANEIILRLPFDQKLDPEVWDFADPKLKPILKNIYRGMLIVWLIIMGYTLIQSFLY